MQAVLDLLDALVELVELLLVLGLLLGREVGRGRWVERELEPVARQVEEAGLEEELEQVEVQRLELAPGLWASWEGGWSGSRSSGP